MTCYAFEGFVKKSGEMTTAVLRRKSTRIIVKNVLIKSQHESHAGFFWFNAPEGKFHVMSMEEPSSTFAKIKKRRQNFNFFLKMSNKAGDWRRCFSSHYSIHRIHFKIQFLQKSMCKQAAVDRPFGYKSRGKSSWIITHALLPSNK